MKIGDLVRMKHEMWWKVRSRAKDYTDQIGIVYSSRGKGIKVAMPDNSIKLGLVDNWEVVSEN
jgi:hypothetical protein